MARVTRIKCDGCKTVLSNEDPWRYLTIRGMTDREIEMCQKCVDKMLAAVGLTKLPEPGEGNEEP